MDAVFVDETEVAIVGAGPAGLVLAHLLAARGIDSVVLEQRDRAYVEHRVRAGVLEHPSVELLRVPRAGRSARPRGPDPPRHPAGLRRGAPPRRLRRADRAVDHRLRPAGGRQGPDRGPPGGRRRDRLRGRSTCARCDVDTDRAVGALPPRRRRARAALPRRRRLRRLVRRVRPARARTGPSPRTPIRSPGWASSPRPHRRRTSWSTPSHERGFALYSMRSPTVTRLYLQVAPDEDLADWSDDRIWSELAHAPAAGRRLPAEHRADHRPGHHRDAQLGVDADAPRQPADRRRRRAHRAGHRRQGDEPGDRRRHGDGRRDRRRAARRATRAPRRVHADVPRTGSGAPSTSPTG